MSISHVYDPPARRRASHIDPVRKMFEKHQITQEQYEAAKALRIAAGRLLSRTTRVEEAKRRGATTGLDLACWFQEIRARIEEAHGAETWRLLRVVVLQGFLLRSPECGGSRTSVVLRHVTHGLDQVAEFPPP